MGIFCWSVWQITTLTFQFDDFCDHRAGDSTLGSSGSSKDKFNHPEADMLYGIFKDVPTLVKMSEDLVIF